MFYQLYQTYGTISSETEGFDGGLLMTDKALENFNKLKLYAENGNYTWKVLGLVAGLLLMGISLLSLLSHLLSPADAILDIYIFFFGGITCVLEFKDRVLTQKYLNIIQREGAFLNKPYGRAAFYIFIGILKMAQDGILNMLIGFYTFVIGVIIYNTSLSATRKLNDFKALLYSEKAIASKFKEFDVNNSGTLETKEIAALCQSLGSNLTLNELESAIFLLDSNSDGRVEYKEFFEWWKGKDY